MATQTKTITASGGGDNVVLELDYDDVSLLLLTVRITNNGTQGTAIITLTDPTTGTVIFTGSRSFGTGTFSKDVSAAGVHFVLIPVPPKFGGGFTAAPPFNIGFDWS